MLKKKKGDGEEDRIFLGRFESVEQALDAAREVRDFFNAFNRITPRVIMP